jgi:hypothetical protein
MAGGSRATLVTIVIAYFLRLQTPFTHRSRHHEITSHVAAMIIWQSSVGLVLRGDMMNWSVNYLFCECRDVLASTPFRFWDGTGVPVGTALPFRRRRRSARRPHKFGLLIYCRFFSVGPSLSHSLVCLSNYGPIPRPRSHLCLSPLIFPDDTPIFFCAATP